MQIWGKETGWMSFTHILLQHHWVFISMPESSVRKFPRFIALIQPNVVLTIVSSNIHSDCIKINSQESCESQPNFWLSGCIKCIYTTRSYQHRFWWAIAWRCSLPPPPHRCPSLKATWVFHHTGWPRPASEGVDFGPMTSIWWLDGWMLGKKSCNNLFQIFWSTQW